MTKSAFVIGNGSGGTVIADDVAFQRPHLDASVESRIHRGDGARLFEEETGFYRALVETGEGKGTTGYIRKEAIGLDVAETSRAGARERADEGEFPVSAPWPIAANSPVEHRYPGASFVGRTAPLVGAGAALGCERTGLEALLGLAIPGTCTGTERWATLFGATFGLWPLGAAPLLWWGYTLLILSDIESRIS